MKKREKYNSINYNNLNWRKISLNFCLHKFLTISIFLQNQSIKRQWAKDHDKIIHFHYCIFFIKKVWCRHTLHASHHEFRNVNLIYISQWEHVKLMKHAFYRIDNLKIVFIKYKFQNTARDENDENKTHFNNFKLHVIIHYMIFIRLFDSVQSFDTVYKKRYINSC